MKNAALLLIFVCAIAALLVAGDFKTEAIKETDSQLAIDVAAHHFLRIYNFTQEGGGTRGVVIAAAATPTPSPTPIPSPTPTPSSTPSPTATPTATPTPTPTPPPRAVLTATMINPAASPEFIKPVVIDGPAHVTVSPIPGATLLITYRKEAEPTPTPTPTP